MAYTIQFPTSTTDPRLTSIADWNCLVPPPSLRLPAGKEDNTAVP